MIEVQASGPREVTEKLRAQRNTNGHPSREGRNEEPNYAAE